MAKSVAGPDVASVGRVKPTAKELAMMVRTQKGQDTAEGMAVSKLGGLQRSPLTDQSQVWDEFTVIANGLDPDQPWTDLQMSYMRDFIQGMWIVKAMTGGIE